MRSLFRLRDQANRGRFDVRPRAWIAFILLFAGTPLWAQTSASPPDNYSGMYTFLKEGEFVQVTIEDAGRVTGFVSRYGDGESDRGAFLDQFFKQGKLDADKLSFTTETVHGVWFDFSGTTERGAGKTSADEAYHVLKGTLIEYRSDVNKKVSSQSREVTFKSFPQNLESPH